MELTKVEIIKRLCEKYGLHPNRSNGQNFLIDKNIIEKIIEAGGLNKEDVVLEIGPGFGVLTQELIKHSGMVIAVERDKRLAEYLKKEIRKENSNLEIINEDILKIQNLKIKNQNYGVALRQHFKIISNLPYQITSPVLWKFLHEDNLPHPTLRKEGRVGLMVLMVQKEVGERICAKKGKMSILAVLCQLYADCEVVTQVNRSCFWPVPEVDSVVIKLEIQSASRQTKLENNHEKIDYKDLMRIVKIGFSAKRKMLKNNLAAGLRLPMETMVKALKEADLDEKIRAQELSIEEWKKVYTKLQMVIGN